jgi:hypothetical protein
MALIASESAGSANGSSVFSTVSTSAIDTSGADLIVISTHYTQSDGKAVTPSDSKSNTWTAAPSQQTAPTSSTGVRFWYCLSPTVGSGHTFTYPASSSGVLHPSITVSAWSDVTGFHSDDGDSTNSNVTTLSTGTVTPSSSAPALIVTALSYKGSSPSVSGGSLALLEQVAYVSGAGPHIGAAMGYELQATGTAIDATWNWTTADDCSVAIIAFGVTTPTVTATSILGEDGTVAGLSRVHFTNLDGVTRTLSDVAYEGAWVIGGRLVFFEQASPPAGVSNTGRIWAEDNGAGKLRLMCQFGTGAAQQLSIEP